MQTKPQRDVVAAETVPSPRVVAVVLAIGLGVLPVGVARAGCTVPFTITTPPNIDLNLLPQLECEGPWGRNSSVINLTGGMAGERFYCADQTIFSMWGGWSCFVFIDIPPWDFEADFCIESTGPQELDVHWDGTSVLTDNGNRTCKGIETASVLGDTATSAGGDRDTYDLSGRSGERLRVKLDRDGTAGGTGEVATVEVKSSAGAALAQKTGRLPLTLDVTLADAGVVLEVGGAQAGQGDAYRGGYVLSVRPAAGNAGKRLLRPRPNVEP